MFEHASGRVSNELGAGRPRVASHASSVSVCLTILLTLAVGALIFVFRYLLQPSALTSCMIINPCL